ncbi:DUF5129 domain-containing protein [Corynebacterium propinquum]
MKPTVGKIVAASILSAGVLGGGAALGIATTYDAPERAHYTIDAPTHSNVALHIHNPDGVLTADDERILERDAARLEVPDVVKQLHYIVFADNDDNVNDTVENYLRDHHPELIGDDSFADGTLFVGVGLDPRQAFIFAGDDVAELLNLREGSHLDESLDAIKPGVKDGNIPGGLFHGATVATDLAALEQAQFDAAESNRTSAIVMGGLGAAALGGGGAAAAGGYRRSRAKKITQAREDFDYISAEFGALAQRLDSIDIRAHSLTSAFADQQLRDQWRKVRERFVRMHDDVSTLGELSPRSDDKAFAQRADQLSDMASTAKKIHHAEDNIDTIFAFENGDELTRRTEAQSLRDDVVEAKMKVRDSDSGLYQELAAIQQRTEALAQDPGAEDFLDNFIVLLRDYQAALAELRRQKFSDIDESKADAPQAPGLTSADYRPGYGWNNFVPYWALSSWHASTLEAQSSSSNSGSANTSFSSGFSGAGGSSGF